MACAWLSQRELDRAQRFVSFPDAHQYLVSHVFLRRILKLHTGVAEEALRIRAGEREKPVLDWSPGRLDFSLSHAREWIAVAVGRVVEVGIDVESVRDVAVLLFDIGSSLPMVLGADEARAVTNLPGAERAAGLARLWTLKEAFAKAVGRGLQLPLRDIQFDLDAERPRVIAMPSRYERCFWSFAEYVLPGDGRVAVAVGSQAGAVDFRLHLSIGLPETLTDEEMWPGPQGHHGS
jgi:4'-phosphopantetheinyl transferase